MDIRPYMRAAALSVPTFKQFRCVKIWSVPINSSVAPESDNVRGFVISAAAKLPYR